jgi:ArsR family transcriptional regulator
VTDGERARYTIIAALIKTVSHPVRLLIMEAVSARPRCIVELAVVTGRSEATISKHVAILKRAGFLAGTKRGLYVFCRSAYREPARICRLADRCIAEMRREPHDVRLPESQSQTSTGHAAASTPSEPHRQRRPSPPCRTGGAPASALSIFPRLRHRRPNGSLLRG